MTDPTIDDYVEAYNDYLIESESDDPLDLEEFIESIDDDAEFA